MQEIGLKCSITTDAEILEIEVNLTHPSHLQLLHSQKFIFMLGFKS